MEIRMVPMSTSVPADSETEPEFVMVELSGPFDPENAVLRRARQLVLESGSPEMLESFDAAVKSGAFLAKAAED